MEARWLREREQKATYMESKMKKKEGLWEAIWVRKRAPGES